ncbi:max protein X [Echinococcus multilocularis]|uniref:Max protein X n=1 Tax=Echinococcus multilocularis TaxID=6211 RepID=A0A068YGG2_ECHMU|nr:max protein X [Echinococcus multilocularis]
MDWGYQSGASCAAIDNLDRTNLEPYFDLMDVSDSMTDSSFAVDVRARRRKLHTEAEQRRRDAIKRGFDSLLELIPPAKTGAANSHFRMSKATVLNRSISMILKASKIQTQKRLEIETLRKKVQALQILKASYERMSSTTTYATETQDAVITDQFKLNLFQMFMESLFISFDSTVSASALPELSDQIITWLETNCKPEFLHQTMEHLLDAALHDGYNVPYHQQCPQRPPPQQHQPQNTMYEVHKGTECLGQLMLTHQCVPNTYRCPSLKLSNSLEAVHESPFSMPDPLSSDQGVMHLSDRYQQPNCHQPLFNTGFDPHSVYPEPSQQNYVRPQHPSVFPIRRYQPPEDRSLSNKFPNTTVTIPTTQRHSSPSSSTVATSSVFQRSPASGSSATARSLVVDSTLPAPQFPPVPPFVSSEGVFAPPQIQCTNSGGGRIPLPDGSFAKQSPF